MLKPFNFNAPATIEEACRLLAEGAGKVIAGGTDVIPQMRDNRFRAEHLIDLSHLQELSYILANDQTIAIGGLTNHRLLEDSTLLQAEAAALAQAAALVGGVQTRTRGTLAGNIANASPAGDTLPPLLILDAQVTLVSAAGERQMPLAEFLQGPGSTAISAQELIREISFARLPQDTKTVFTRLGNRRGMAISVVSVAALLRLGANDKGEEVRIALGAVAPKAVRCPPPAALLKGKRLTKARIERAAETAVQECKPIDDLRASAEYRRHGVKILVTRSLQALAGKEG